MVFTSVAGVWGSRDEGARAVAHARLDALAHRARAAGGDVVSVAWGLWDLAEDSGDARRQGLPPLEPRLALTALGRALAGGDRDLAIADIVWDRFAPLFTMARPSRLFDAVPAAQRALEAARGPDDAEAADRTAALRRDLAAVPADERPGRLLSLVRASTAEVLRHDAADAVDPDSPFKDLGFDSMAAVGLRNRLRAATGLRLPATVGFDHPTPRRLAGYLLAQILPAESGTGHPALGRLDELDAALAELPMEDPRRTGLMKRMQGLLWKYAAEAGEAAEASGDGPDIEAASAEDMFALIDRELGA